jgi:hypothetical protein
MRAAWNVGWPWLVFASLVAAVIYAGGTYDDKTLLRAILPWSLFVVSLLMGIGVCIAVRNKLGEKMGLPSWDFSSSWATNITVTGTLAAIPILSTVPTAPPARELEMMPRAGYVGLTMMFLVLAAAAPLVYNFSRTPSKGKASSGAPSVVAYGRVYMFIAAGAVTTFAAAGQILIVEALIEELRRGGYVGSFVFVIEAILMFVGLWLFVYAPRTMYTTIELLPEPSSGVRIAADQPQRPAWPLL